MPAYSVGLAAEAAGGSLEGLTVAVLGASYRGGVKETAFSGVFATVAELSGPGPASWSTTPCSPMPSCATSGGSPMRWVAPWMSSWCRRTTPSTAPCPRPTSPGCERSSTAAGPSTAAVPRRPLPGRRPGRRHRRGPWTSAAARRDTPPRPPRVSRLPTPWSGSRPAGPATGTDGDFPTQYIENDDRLTEARIHERVHPPRQAADRRRGARGGRPGAAQRHARPGPRGQGRFEEEFSEHFGLGRACVAVNSGTSGQHLGLLSSGVKAGDEVIVPSFTFAATANSVALTGATPVFADISADDFCLDPAPSRRRSPSAPSASCRSTSTATRPR